MGYQNSQLLNNFCDFQLIEHSKKKKRLIGSLIAEVQKCHNDVYGVKLKKIDILFVIALLAFLYNQDYDGRDGFDVFYGIVFFK